MTYGVLDAILWVFEEGWRGSPLAKIAKDLEDFAAVDYELEALVMHI
jgi:hypothetical protein